MKVIDKEDSVIEIVLDSEEVNNLAKKLEELKLSKGHIHFGDGANELLIHHEDDKFLK